MRPLPRPLLWALLVLLSAPGPHSQPRGHGDLSWARGPECAAEPAGASVVYVAGREVRVWSLGGFRTAAPALHVEALCPGAVLDLEVHWQGELRRLSYRATRDGVLVRTYTVGARSIVWGREAEALEARLLPAVVAHLEARP